MRFVLLTVLFLVFNIAPVAAQTAPDALAESPRDCLRRHVVISGATAGRRSLTFDVRNDLQWPLSGVRIGQRVQSPDRSVPWVNDSAAVPVAGGVEPGETRTVTIGFTPIPPQFPIGGLAVDIDLLDVADAEQRLFLSTARVAGWSRVPSPNTCG